MKDIKSTSQLNELLDNEKALDELSASYAPETFKECVQILLDRYGYSQNYIVNRLPCDYSYVHRMLSEKISISRDLCIGIVLVLELGRKGIEEANHLLMKAGKASLYSKNKWDMYVMHCIIKKKTIQETNDLLESKGLRKLFFKSNK